MIIKVDARRIREDHLILRTKNNKLYEHRVIEITERKCGDMYFRYKLRYIKYEDGTSTSISLSPSQIDGWVIVKIKLDSSLQLIFLPFLFNANDKFKYFDFLRLIIIITVIFFTIRYFL
jgi:hypothetical protein